MKEKAVTLCFIFNGEKILLGMKKKGFGQGFLNGFGGKIESGETPEEATIREIKEETGLSIKNLRQIGFMIYDLDNVQLHLTMPIFITETFHGKIKASDEMDPVWFDKNDLPFEKFWPGDQLWIPLVLIGKKFEGYIHYKDFQTIIKHEIHELGN